MEFPGLRTLVLVVDRGSFASAAEASGVPRSTLARRLDRLESELDEQLVVRSEMGVHPTPAGARLLEHARGIVEDYDALVKRIRSE